MPTHTNAASELVKFWLEARHGYLVGEGIPVPVVRGLSDIDLVAYHPTGVPISLPSGKAIGPRLIVETKDEHDFDPLGSAFGSLLRHDIARMGDAPFIPAGLSPVKFSMLRQEHFARAVELFGTEDFDRLFVVHAIQSDVLVDLEPVLSANRIWWLTIPSLVRDLLDWYPTHLRPTALRNTLIGDLLHLLVGYCGLGHPTAITGDAPG